MHGHACKQYIFWSYDTSTFNAIRFDENPVTCQHEKEDKKAKGFKFSHFYWLCFSDLMAVNGLKWVCNLFSWVFYIHTGDLGL